MTWFLIILNLYGGQPTFIEMSDKATCEAAAAVSKQKAESVARVWCIEGTSWEN